MLKTIENTGSTANSEEIKSKVGGSSMVGNSMVDGGKTTNQANSTKRKNQAKMTKSKILVKFKNHDFPLNSRNREVGTDFFIPEARIVFT